METKSEYFSNLSADSKVRYESKVTYTGLTKDPYAINQSGWTDSPETVPEVYWSDMMLRMIATPSPYTRQEIRVSF